MDRRAIAGKLRETHQDVALDGNYQPKHSEVIARGASVLWSVIEEVEQEAASVERRWAREEIRQLASSIEESETLLKWAGTAISRADERFARGDYHEAREDALLAAELIQRAAAV